MHSLSFSGNRGSSQNGAKSIFYGVHDDHVSQAELILNPELFKGIAPGDCVALHNPVNGERVVLLVSSVDHSIFRQRSFQISLHRDIAKLFSFHSRRDVYVKKFGGKGNFPGERAYHNFSRSIHRADTDVSHKRQSYG